MPALEKYWENGPPHQWRIGRCKVEGCEWVYAELETEKFTVLSVTERMIEHTEETGHPCTSEVYYPRHGEGT